jgi:hypothetical protein
VRLLLAKAVDAPDNESMVVQGRVENGVVVLRNGFLPEGTEVRVVPTAPLAHREVLSEAERLRIFAVMEQIAALPVEGSSEPFSGADHDKVLYGKS